MKVLVREGKYGNSMYNASTSEKEEAAYMAVFNEMDDEGCYEYDLPLDAPDTEEKCEPCQKGLHRHCEGCKCTESDCKRKASEMKSQQKMLNWYAKAKKGDVAAAKALVDYRSQQGYEYESVELHEVQEP